MDDLISRSDAIGAVKEERFPIDSDYAEGFMAALDKVEWILKEWLPSEQPELPEWAQKVEEYRKSAPSFVRNQLTWALYQTWKEYDGRLVHQRRKENR